MPPIRATCSGFSAELIKSLATPALSPNLGFVLTEAVSPQSFLKGAGPFPREHFKYNYRGDSDSKIHFTKHFPFYLKTLGWRLSGAKHLADLISSHSLTNQVTMNTRGHQRHMGDRPSGMTELRNGR